MTPARTSAYAPGRVELLGNHTDYNGGVVLAGAIDRGLVVSGTARSDGIADLTSTTLGQRVRMPLSDVQPIRGEQAWANYALGVVREFLDAGLRISGFEAEVAGDLPLGSGLSSSAAFEVATAFFILKLNKIEMPALEIAKLCRRAENRFVGVPSGLLDQVTSIFGRAGHLVYLDCRSEEIRTLPIPESVALVIADSSVRHRLDTGEYAVRREQCRAAATALGVPTLRDANAQQLAAGHLDPLLHRRADHIINENDRVWRAADLLSLRDEVGLGALMYASHESSRTKFENSTAELDMLVEIARAQPGVLGSRLTGGGFGGATVSLVRTAQAEAAAREIAATYMSRSGHRGIAFVCRVGDGAA